MPGHNAVDMENDGSRTQYGGASRLYKAGAPSNTTDVGYLPGAQVTDYTNGDVYINNGTAAAPLWTKLYHAGDGVTPAGGFTVSPRGFHSGGNSAMNAADGSEITTATNLSYLCEVFVGANATLTGIAVFKGTVTPADSWVVALYSSTGAVLAQSAATSVAATSDIYQLIPFTATYAAVGPATYYVGVQCSGTTDKINSHTVGAFGAGSVSSTYPTVAAVTVPTTFTTVKGPIATLY